MTRSVREVPDPRACPLECGRLRTDVSVSHVNARGTTASGGLHGDLRPKVLLVDDHLPVLEVVRSVLEPQFYIVGALTDGQLAVDAALRLDPDVIVLDVAMPGMDGFQTASELKRRGSRAPTVFLTMHDAEDTP